MAIRLPRRLKLVVVLALLGIIVYTSLSDKTIVLDPLNKLQRTKEASSTFNDQVHAQNAEARQRTSKELPLNEFADDNPVKDLPAGMPAAKPVEIKPLPSSSKKASSSANVVQPTPIALRINDKGTLQQATAPTIAEKPTLPTYTGSPIVKFPIGRKEHHPVPKDELYKLPTDRPRPLAPIQTTDPSLTETPAQKEERLARRSEIRDTMLRDWSAYKKYAWMHDELMPVSNSSYDPFGGWGATLVDSLDTLLIMELYDEYKEASAAVAKIDFTYTESLYIPTFETTIRYLGGLLAAYDVGVSKNKKDPVMLQQAQTLAKLLYAAFDTPNRLPILRFNYRAQAEDTQGLERAEAGGVMAEPGSLSVEFTRLAQLTGGEEGNKYFDAIQRITDAFEEASEHMVIPGLWPLRLDFSGCNVTEEADGPAPTSPSALDFAAPRKREVVTKEECIEQGIRAPPGWQAYSQGGMADSTYEYFTKEYLLLGGVPAADQYKRMYERSIEATKKWLLFRPIVPGNFGAKEILMTGDVVVNPPEKPIFQPKMQHLSCFIGGMVAMGSKVFSRPEELKIAARLTEGCVWAYNSSIVGVAPEVFHMHECKDAECSWEAFLQESEQKAKFFAAEEAKAKAKLQVPTDRPTPREPPKKRGEVVNNEAAQLAASNFQRSQEEKAHTQNTHESQSSTPQPIYHLDARYILRPEAIESVWYMYRITGDRKWQEKGWQMWQAIEKLTRTAVAHSAVYEIDDPWRVRKVDSLESFWFAETLKYFYLLFSDFKTISLDEWVLNTEAHPLKRPVP